MAKNSLAPLGRKIFLDRYALKDGKKESLKVDDLVVAVSNPQTGQREIGRITKIDGDEITVELEDGSIVESKREYVDKPIETDPAQMLNRVAKGIAQQEREEVRSEWEKEFAWLLEDWKFVPGGRI